MTLGRAAPDVALMPSGHGGLGSIETVCLSAESEDAVGRAVACLRGGGLVGLPTETVYGLAGDATNGEAVARIFEAKGRPGFNPLICHVSDLDMTARLAVMDDVARVLAARFWPGPLTIVLPQAEGTPVHPLTTGGLATIALRQPKGIAGDIIGRLGRPLAAPSANPSGRVSATSAAQVMRGLGGRIEMILDAGPSELGLESTIVKPERDRLVLLRAGLVGRDALREATGLAVVAPDADSGIQAPGQLRSHYAPHGTVRLDATHVEPGEYLIAFGATPTASAAAAAECVNLSPSGDLREAAANLFAALARFDRPEIGRIAVAPIPQDGLGEAINDRLRRAAAPRG
ncbi:L-threonylcarbamoyladenylate synthase [Aurantimonas marina]|uniref:L-threonylcarbamoyladenylate synthase n=1 Tax=Aurantimonas marina TaxID=2780508 RepID=UPI001E48BCDB|nr:L-threonylcarbamoyladenylate synthase [Aurantimonas marina]